MNLIIAFYRRILQAAAREIKAVFGKQNSSAYVSLKPGFHIVVSVVSVVRKKFIGQMQIYGNLPYKCSIQKKRQIQPFVRDRMNSICPTNFFRTTDTTDTTDTTIWEPGLSLGTNFPTRDTTSTEARTSSENVTSHFCNHFQLFKVIMLEKCLLTVLESIWNQRVGDKKTKLNICHHMLSTKLQNRSFHVVERTRTSKKCQKMKNARAGVQKYCFSLSNMQICGVFVAVCWLTPVLYSKAFL